MSPSWRNSVPATSNVSSASNPNLSNRGSNVSTSRHTIWDIPERKYDGSSADKPSYYPTKSNTHFSFVPKPETKPGTILPAYVETSQGTLNSVKQASSSWQDVRKPCLKTQSTISLKSRSQSPSVQVKFSPQLPKRSKESPKSDPSDPPFEWIDFKTPDGKALFI